MQGLPLLFLGSCFWAEALLLPPRLRYVCARSRIFSVRSETEIQTLWLGFLAWPQTCLVAVVSLARWAWDRGSAWPLSPDLSGTLTCRSAVWLLVGEVTGCACLDSTLCSKITFNCSAAGLAVPDPTYHTLEWKNTGYVSSSLETRDYSGSAVAGLG